MRLMKMFGLVAIAAVAAMAFGGAGTASATGIAICKKNELPCPLADQFSSVHATPKAGTVGQLLNNTVENILCLEVLAEAHIEGALLHATQLNALILVTFGQCGWNAAHNDCSSIKTVGEENGLAVLMKVAANLGTIKGTAAKPGRVNVQCKILGVPIDCDYSGERLTFPVEGAGHTAGAGNGRLIANKTPADLTERLNKLLCPSDSTLDAELISLSPIFITG